MRSIVLFIFLKRHTDCGFCQMFILPFFNKKMPMTVMLVAHSENASPYLDIHSPISLVHFSRSCL